MAEISVSIAKEESVQDINIKIGANSDQAGAGDEASLFAKLAYAGNTAKTLEQRLTSTVMLKVDGIGEAEDTGETTVFGLSKSIKAILGEDELIEQPLNTTGVSGSGALIASFKVDYHSRLYNFYAEMKASTAGSAYAAKVILADKPITNENEGVRLMIVPSTSIVRTFANAYLESGKTYRLYLFGAGTPQLSSLFVRYYNKSESALTPVILASDNIRGGPAAVLSGSGSTLTTVFAHRIRAAGTVRVLYQKADTATKIVFFLNGYAVYTDVTATSDQRSKDIIVGEGDVLEVKACNTSGATWQLSRISYAYDVDWAGACENIVKL